MKSKDLINQEKTKESTGKLRITCWIDEDIYDELNRQATEGGEKYQVLLNKYLRRYLFKEVTTEDLETLEFMLKHLDKKDIKKKLGA